MLYTDILKLSLEITVTMKPQEITEDDRINIKD